MERGREEYLGIIRLMLIDLHTTKQPSKNLQEAQLNDVSLDPVFEVGSA